MARCTRCCRIAFVLVLLMLTPLSFSRSKGVEENGACGGDSPTCVEEIDSTCSDGIEILEDHYLKG